MKRISGNLTQQVTQSLGRAIVQGHYSSGNSFPTEAELAIQFDISRSIIREAVKMLSAKGLLASRPRQGIRLKPVCEWNLFDTDILSWTLAGDSDLGLLREFTQLRVAIEPEAAALAARCGDASQIKAIEEALERMRRAESGEDDSLEADIDFHTAILLASNNRFFSQFRHFVTTSLRVSVRYTVQIKSAKYACAKEHDLIYRPIKQSDPNGARAALKSHLYGVMSLIDATLGL